MEKAPDNVRQIDTAKKSAEAMAQKLVDDSRRDMGKVGLIISLLAIVLLVVFYFGLNQNIRGLSQEISKLGALKGDVTQVQERLEVLEKAPQQIRNMVYQGIIQDMAQKAGFLSGQLDETQAQKLVQVQNLLREVMSSTLATPAPEAEAPAEPSAQATEAKASEEKTPETEAKAPAEPSAQAPETEIPEAEAAVEPSAPAP
ncbi:MAG: hypothetical protein JW718_08180, partial [Desulfovibrionaceae bacterium]|nr:hypothetical protein [Desulfovibrionaceae bacterium]